MTIHKTAHARVGLIGNPSDGYHGKTISAILNEFRAKIVLSESPDLRIEPDRRDLSTFRSMEELVETIRARGYYGGVRLIKATMVKFHDYAASNAVAIEPRNFTIRYESDIPMRVGLAGSSAIVTAAMLALMEFYGVEIPKPFLPTLIQRVETEELGIAAGLQDRVIQVYGGCMHMDFDRTHFEEHHYGRYEAIDPRLLPPLYVAHSPSLAEGTEVVHGGIRDRWEKGDPKVREGMKQFAQITDDFYEALKAGDTARMSRLMNANFDLRASLCKIGPANWELINTARAVGASAKFCGSGGAAVGIYADETMFDDLAAAMKRIGAEVIRLRF